MAEGNNVIIDNDIITAFFLLLVNANCTLLCKTYLDKSRLKRKCWRTMRKPTVLRIASTSQMMVGLVEVLTAQVGSA